jgi:hypothetical protein
LNGGSLVLHIVPLSAFDRTASLSLRQIERNWQSFAPIGSSTANGARVNFDGILKTSNANQRATEQRAYVQLYRNGIIETVASSLAGGSPENPIIFNLDDVIIGGVLRSLRDLVTVGVEPPYALLVSLVGVAGAQFSFSRGHAYQWSDDLGESLDRDQYHFDEVIFETIPSNQADCAGVIRPILDQMANAGGKAMSPIFDDQGRYIAPGR